MGRDTDKWDGRFLELAALVATWSKDESTKVGCVVVGTCKEIRSVGYNGFPRGVNDDVEERRARPEKYFWTSHSEVNAVFNATRFGASLSGCTLYCTHPPCADCARAIIQCGIFRVVVMDGDWGASAHRWVVSNDRARTMFGEACVDYRVVPRTP